MGKPLSMDLRSRALAVVDELNTAVGSISVDQISSVLGAEVPVLIPTPEA